MVNVDEIKKGDCQKLAMGAYMLVCILCELSIT
jgi:hypothetical protein